MTIRTVVWNEFIHERENPVVKEIYPDGIHGTIAAFLSTDQDFAVSTATLDEPEHGLPQARLDETDVLVWWGHKAHGQVSDEIADRVASRVHEGMGLIVLHSGHFAKVFKRLMGTPCSLRWREAGERERLWAVNRSHPIVQGIGPAIELPNAEMYGEPFLVPEPMETVFISWFEGGEVFRSGLTYQRGAGKIFYFRPGHETYPIYHNAEIQTVVKNAVRWAYNPVPAWKDVAAAPNVPADKAPETLEVKGPRLHKAGEAGYR
ncbi:ThuA domain-containing protein [Aurantimonas sp. C2-6-R+9]|uniref:ThuA domain-containing protein n=1 Tax=unclassified Aurantimonas TaxID=2638230 RepID=UPI002E193E2C|nr:MULTISPECIES: ThuA domain-containing protein [unclassified Aurantimonas]MEC5290354.1 ThuA domain-containing protein [Aurantimonas sp. C2-3-R2]MEC5379814.1 ThuA domain-containing protein [Aurantimonas sp. C2-6-R+9]MEC5411390.1 ThuA domain-containing protein [Aurantimonas sp. C2-4-R8]